MSYNRYRYERFNTFAEVEEKYNTTKPVISPNRKKLYNAIQFTKEHDIRPVSARRYQWERIIKVDDNCYAISSGGNYDPVFTWAAMHGVPTVDDVHRCAPIVWERTAEGEVLTIRFAEASATSHKAYDFFYRFLPRGFSFSVNRNALRSISLRDKGVYYLPTSKVISKPYYDYLKTNVRNWYPDAVAEDDGKCLRFLRTGAVWEYIGPPEMAGKPYKYIDKAEKAPYRAHIRVFMAWIHAMYPLLTKDGMKWDAYKESYDTIAKWCKDNGDVGLPRDSNDPLRMLPVNILRDIISNPDHELRFAVGHCFIYGMYHLKGNMYGEDPTYTSRARAAMRRLNTLCGFVKKGVKV